MPDPVVEFQHVSKRFRIGQSHDSLCDLLTAGVGRLLGRKRKSGDRSTFWALRDVAFSVGQGEAVGIIGPNGAGKSTVLKLLAGILRADQGQILVRGRLAALIEVGAGFHGDLTGRENIFLNGAILGMSRREIRDQLDAIVAFAGIGKFLDMPVKRYSSGMYARLGFSIAAHVKPDILLVDEVLSVGDAVFRLRCMDRMRELVRSGTTLVFVTHQLDQMQTICPKAVVLDEGRTLFQGSSREAVGHYLTATSRAYIAQPTDLSGDDDGATGAVEMIGLRLVRPCGEELVYLRPDEPLRAELTFRLAKPIKRMVVELNMRATVHQETLSFNSGREGVFFAGRTGLQTISVCLPVVPLAGGQYFWNARIWDADTGTTELDTPFSVPMVIDDGGRRTGLLSLEHEWREMEILQSEASVDGLHIKSAESIPETQMNALEASPS